MTNRIKEAEVILRLRGCKSYTYFTQGGLTKEGLCNYLTRQDPYNIDYCLEEGSVLLVGAIEGSGLTHVTYVIACKEHAEKYLKYDCWSLA